MSEAVKVEIGGVVKASHKEGDVTVIDDFELKEVSIVKDKDPELSVIIPVLNCVDMTQRCIESIKCSEPYNLIVVDNGSIDNTEEYLRNLAKEKGIPFEYIDGDTVHLSEEERIKSQEPTK